MEDIIKDAKFKAAVDHFDQMNANQEARYAEIPQPDAEKNRSSGVRRLAGRTALGALSAVALVGGAKFLSERADHSPSIQYQRQLQENQAHQPSQAEINRAVQQEETQAAHERQAVEMQDNNGTHIQ
jgi:cytochrome c-type biogenesis protein CcmH/NrfG